MLCSTPQVRVTPRVLLCRHRRRLWAYPSFDAAIKTTDQRWTVGSEEGSNSFPRLKPAGLIHPAMQQLSCSFPIFWWHVASGASDAGHRAGRCLIQPPDSNPSVTWHIRLEVLDLRCLILRSVERDQLTESTACGLTCAGTLTSFPNVTDQARHLGSVSKHEVTVKRTTCGSRTAPWLPATERSAAASWSCALVPRESVVLLDGCGPTYWVAGQHTGLCDHERSGWLGTGLSYLLWVIYKRSGWMGKRTRDG